MWKRLVSNLRNVDLVFNVSSRNSSTKICIVGSGPAGFYTAQHLIKNNSQIEVDMYEKLPVPFGLVRYGVAPDHPDVKNVINTFTSIAKSGKLQFVGNVTIGKDVTLKELRRAYNVVVLAYGAAQDRWLGIPGENSKNVFSARKFVGWYNGLPEERNIQVNLDVDIAVIIGHGNVALDVARILLTPIDILRKTDIAQHALEALSMSKIRRVKIIGRRGPLQVAFTIKELRELTELPNCRGCLRMENIASLEKMLSDLGRPRKRITELMIRNSAFTSEFNPSFKEWEILFCRTPKKIIANDANQVTEVIFGLNKLSDEDLNKNIRVIETEEEETIPCGMVIKSIGYQSLPLADELPFDRSRGVIRQTEGRVDGMPGLYCSGWVASGATGVIASTLQNGHDVGRRILQDLETVNPDNELKPGKDAILPLLEVKGVKPVTFFQWEKLDQEEQHRGLQHQKPREKIVDVCEMLNIAQKS